MVITTVGEGYNTLSLVKRAQELSVKNNYDSVWCVFDKDDFNENEFNAAIKLAEECKFEVAYSNQAFEYWIILHLDDHQGSAMHRRSYCNKINALLAPFKLSYDGEGRKLITGEIFDLLAGIDEKTGKQRRQLAIDRAQRNLKLVEGISPAKAEASTTVFRLVETLDKFI